MYFPDLNLILPNKPFTTPKTVLPSRVIGIGDVTFQLYSGLPAVYMVAKHVIQDRCENLYDMHLKDVFVYLANDIDACHNDFFKNIDQLSCVDLSYDKNTVIGYFVMNATENCKKHCDAYADWYWENYDAQR